MSAFPYPFPVFQPAMRVITAITNSNPISVTTSFNHQYQNGLLVRLNIPVGFGMEQVNQQIGTVTVTSDTTFTLPIDSTNYTPFVVPDTLQFAQVVPVGEITNIVYLATKNVLPFNHIT